MGGSVEPGTEGLDVPVAQIVAEDDDEIRLPSVLGGATRQELNGEGQGSKKMRRDPLDAGWFAEATKYKYQIAESSAPPVLLGAAASRQVVLTARWGVE